MPKRHVNIPHASCEIHPCLGHSSFVPRDRHDGSFCFVNHRSQVAVTCNKLLAATAANLPSLFNCSSFLIQCSIPQNMSKAPLHLLTHKLPFGAPRNCVESGFQVLEELEENAKPVRRCEEKRDHLAEHGQCDFEFMEVDGVWTSRWRRAQWKAWRKRVFDGQTWRQMSGPTGAVMSEIRDLDMS